MAKIDQHTTHEHRDDELIGVADAHCAGPYLYRPGQILVGSGDARRVGELLGEQSSSQSKTLEGSGLVVLSLSDEHERDVPRVIDLIRSSPGGEALRVAPNHVAVLTSHYMYVSGLPPRPAGDLAQNDGKGDITVGVIDSGLSYEPGGNNVHPWFNKRCDGDPETLPAAGAAPLPFQAGHGTFVAGIVLQNAPAARVIVHSAQDAEGVIDDLQIAAAVPDMVRKGAQILNLSLGGYTHDDMGLMALPLALRKAREERPDLIVVAAAGNHATTRPFFPAAFKDVMAVGATDANGTPACFTNRGWWVDANAEGVDVHSTFVVWDGPREPFLNVPSRCYQAAHDAMEAGNTFKGFAHWSGTSFAAPRVTAALVNELAAGKSAHEAVDTVIRNAPNRIPDLGAVVA